jgi:ribonuclease HIII
MVVIDDYVARIEETCGKEKDFIVIFKYDKKEQALAKILEKAKVEKSISAIIFELTFKNVSFRLYSTGKAIFRNLKEKSELQNFLADLLL